MTKKTGENLSRIRSVAAVIITLWVSIMLNSCVESPGPKVARGSGCGWGMATGDTATGLGMMDYNAGYVGKAVPVHQGDRLVIKGQFPHSRYMSFVIYDQDFMTIDALPDTAVKPSSGVNPFIPGAPRNTQWLGEYEIQVLMQDPPPGPRPPNTLYAGQAHDGKPNKTAVIGYRVYLADQGYGYRDKNPLAVFGGVEPQSVQLYNQAGEPYCPSEWESKLHSRMTMLSILKANLQKLANPKAVLGQAANPPAWINNASQESRRENTYVPNDETAYVFAPISNKFGELLVLRWSAARSPQQTYQGAALPEDYDVRYWSLSFNYIDMSRPLKIYSQKTVADVFVPTLPDGTRQLVIGFDNVARPALVPEEQWVSVKFKEGLIVMRSIVVHPRYAGDFGKLPQGKIAAEYDKYTPGGVYCSVQEFQKDPDIGLRRAALIR